MYTYHPPHTHIHTPTITMTPPWASWRLKSPANRLCVQQLVQANIKEIIIAPHSGPFVRGIHRWPVDFTFKGPMMPKASPFHDVIMTYSNPHTSIRMVSHTTSSSSSSSSTTTTTHAILTTTTTKQHTRYSRDIEWQLIEWYKNKTKK